MRWSVVLVCILLLAVVAEGKKKKPSKGKKPGKKPSKPGVKGECDVGSPKLTPQNTKKYTGTGKCACWWDITRNDCACCKKGVGAMQCGFPMHKFCYKKSDMGCPGVCNYKYTLSGKGYPCFSDHSKPPARTARGATRTVGSVSRTRSLDQTRRREAAAKQGRTRSTARPSKGIASTSATVIPTPLARRKPTWASLDSTGSASATRDTLETESNAWTAMATSVPNLANKLR
jgi:hypothetical protein